MNDWRIRLARSDDAEHLPPIERAAGQMFASLPDFGWVADQLPIPAQDHRRYIARGHCLVAIPASDRAGDGDGDGDAAAAPIGFIATQPFGRDLHIREVSVSPDWQGRGIGSALMRACMIDARNSGFTALTLTTFREVPWNAPFYRRLGFTDVDPGDHSRLASELENEYAQGMPRDTRVAMTQALC